jgi:cytochrome c peroxidase
MLKICRYHYAVSATLLLAGATALIATPPPAQSDSKPAVSGADRDHIQGLNFRDESGAFSTFSTTGHVDLKNAFFTSLGTNGRTCQTCHQPKFGWTITPASVKEVFDDTGGRDPLFTSNDGMDSPGADKSSVQARRRASSMLLSKGLIRIGLPIPPTAEFALADVDDPYHHSSSADLSLFRRPLPTANLPFLSAVMWDGRQNKAGRSMNDNLASQALDAINGHAQRSVGNALSADVLQSIVTFETKLFMAQTYDAHAGWLNQDGGLGGPQILSQQNFYIGINDPLGMNPTGAAFDPSAFTLYTAWAGSNPNEEREGDEDRESDAHASVVRGEVLFNTKPIAIVGVAGLNDTLHNPLIHGTCTTCHDAPNAGDHSVALPLNIGLTDASRRTPDLPLYTLINKTTGETVETTDPGRALISGKWADIGKFKGPILRGLATRAPYFHNGSAAKLSDAVTFYNTRFNIGLTKRESKDIVAFLRTL